MILATRGRGGVLTSNMEIVSVTTAILLKSSPNAIEVGVSVEVPEQRSVKGIAVNKPCVIRV